MGPRAGTGRVEQTELTGLAGCEVTVRFGQCLQNCWVGEVAVAGVEVVVATHRPVGQVHLRSVRVALADGGADELPDDGMCEFGFDAVGRCRTR